MRPHGLGTVALLLASGLVVANQSPSPPSPPPPPAPPSAASTTSSASSGRGDGGRDGTGRSRWWDAVADEYEYEEEPPNPLWKALQELVHPFALAQLPKMTF